jgi:hypothetical protein
LEWESVSLHDLHRRIFVLILRDIVNNFDWCW